MGAHCNNRSAFAQLAQDRNEFSAIRVKVATEIMTIKRKYATQGETKKFINIPVGDHGTTNLRFGHISTLSIRLAVFLLSSQCPQQPFFCY